MNEVSVSTPGPIKKSAWYFSQTCLSLHETVKLTTFLSLTDKHPTQKKNKKPAGHRKFQFFVYSPEHDRECEAVKVMYMTYH